MICSQTQLEMYHPPTEDDALIAMNIQIGFAYYCQVVTGFERAVRHCVNNSMEPQQECEPLIWLLSAIVDNGMLQSWRSQKDNM